MAPREKGREISSLRAKVDLAQRQMHEMAVAPLFVEQFEGGSVMLQSRGLFVKFELCALDDSMLHAQHVSGKDRVHRPLYDEGPFCQGRGSQLHRCPARSWVELL